MVARVLSFPFAVFLSLIQPTLLFVQFMTRLVKADVSIYQHFGNNHVVLKQHTGFWTYQKWLSCPSYRTYVVSNCHIGQKMLFEINIDVDVGPAMLTRLTND